MKRKLQRNLSNETKKRGRSIGGQVMATRQREQAIASYLAAPNYCKYCGKMIPIVEGRKISRIRQKTFCGHSCAAKFNNAGIKRLKSKRAYSFICNDCGGKKSFQAERCHACNLAYQLKRRGDKTKGNLRKNRGYYTSFRSAVSKHAREIFELNTKPENRECFICGYKLYVEVCHIISVADFPDGATLSEINSFDNLVALCPNHHWEFDNGLLNGGVAKKEGTGLHKPE